MFPRRQVSLNPIMVNFLTSQTVRKTKLFPMLIQIRNRAVRLLARPISQNSTNTTKQTKRFLKGFLTETKTFSAPVSYNAYRRSEDLFAFLDLIIKETITVLTVVTCA